MSCWWVEAEFITLLILMRLSLSLDQLLLLFGVRLLLVVNVGRLLRDGRARAVGDRPQPPSGSHRGFAR